MAEDRAVSTTAPYEQIPDPQEVGHLIAGVIAVASAYHDLAPHEEERREAIGYIRAAVDKWLEAVSPIEHVPGLIDDLANAITRPLWEAIPDITEDLFERIILESLAFKEAVYRVKEQIILNALAELYEIHVGILLEGLCRSASKASEIMNKYLSDIIEPAARIRRLLTIVSIALVLSTNNKHRSLEPVSST